MPPGQESLVIIVDYKSTTLRTNPSISVARKASTFDQDFLDSVIAHADVEFRSYISYNNTMLKLSAVHSS